MGKGKTGIENLGSVDAARCGLCQDKRRCVDLYASAAWHTCGARICGRCLLGLTMQVLQGKTWQPPKKGGEKNDD